ncbi:universal stress protein [Thalassotalea sp. M1531]|uniref:Universal stress protein n=1 Tax=Thalassotalea algicola TaxID=2716224 RepID=A0A7Y0LAQ3_9GAMM|nr:universal stress protein [Thalassotalea algicola]NMP30877.1 universal stress protein [Thalassotalea algicola]
MTKILVIADFDEQQTVAIERAKEYAELKGANLHIVYFCHENFRHVPGDHEALKEKILATQKLNAKAQLDAIDMSGIDYEFEVVWESRIAYWVQGYVERESPDMVLKTGNRSETFFYTPTDWQLLRECSAPLMISAEKKWRKTPNVLAAIDLETSIESKRLLNTKVLQQAKSLADFQESELFICYTIPFSPLLRDLGMQYTDELERQAEDSLKETIEQIAKEYGIPVENFVMKAGQPEKVIPSTAAKAKAGVVVMGTVARKGIAGKLMGNTAEKVLKLLKSDVIAIKPDS